MADKNVIEAVLRERGGKGAARRTRREGLVPGVIYGGKKDPITIAVDFPTLQRTLQHNPQFLSTVYTVKVDGEEHKVLPRDMQLDALTDFPIHIDFLRLTGDAEINVTVPVDFQNEEDSPGVKRGGVLNIVRHEVELYAKADAIPQSIVVDLAGTDIGDSIHISHVSLPEGTRPVISDRDFTIATVAAPSGMAAAEEAEAEEGEEAEAGEGEG